MRVSIPTSLPIYHQHGDIGPESRSHLHGLAVTFRFDPAFDPLSGRLVGYDEFVAAVLAVLQRYDGKDLADIPGIRPTVPSLALRLREELLGSFSTARISITTEDYTVEVP